MQFKGICSLWIRGIAWIHQHMQEILFLFSRVLLCTPSGCQLSTEISAQLLDTVNANEEQGRAVTSCLALLEEEKMCIFQWSCNKKKKNQLDPMNETCTTVPSRLPGSPALT